MTPNTEQSGDVREPAVDNWRMIPLQQRIAALEQQLADWQQRCGTWNERCEELQRELADERLRAGAKEDDLEQQLATVTGERQILALERRASDSEMVALLKRTNKEFLDRAEAAEGSLRAIASSLSVNGCDEATDAEVYLRRIMDGIDMLTRPLLTMKEAAEQQVRELHEVDQLRTELAAATERAEAAEAKRKNLSHEVIRVCISGPPDDDKYSSVAAMNAGILFARKALVESELATAQARITALTAENERLRRIMQGRVAELERDGSEVCMDWNNKLTATEQTVTTLREQVERLGMAKDRISLMLSHPAGFTRNELVGVYESMKAALAASQPAGSEP